MQILKPTINETIQLSDSRINTNVSGLMQIERFYQRARVYNDININIGIKEMEWIDGNMSAMLGAALYRLNIEHGLTFSISFADVNKKFPILFQNGLINTDAIKLRGGNKGSTIPFKSFMPDDKDGFIEYVLEKLLVHDGMPEFSEVTTEKLLDYLAELCCNINLHGETEYPFFVCGQYYPKLGRVIFTVTDLGKGFLPKIKNKTAGEVSSARAAVLWAIEGNTTKLDAPGGIHLNKMRDFFLNHDGHLHIITGDAYYNTNHADSTARPDKIADVKQEFMGSTVHLVFNKNSLL